MHQIIAGVLIGAAAIMFGPRIISDVAGALRPVGEGILHFGETAVGTVTSSVSAVGNWVSGLVGSGTETTQASSEAPSQASHSDKKEESFLQEAEEFGKDIVVGLAEEEAISFIKLALIAII
jgi:hypothetical protein